MKSRANFFQAAVFSLLAIFLAGCSTLGEDPNGGAPAKPGGDILNVGDQITVVFSDLPPPAIAPFEQHIKDDGTVTLLNNQTFQAAGKTRGVLEAEIHDRYVPGYYTHLTVTVKQELRFYYVGGEVSNPSQQPYVGEMTVLKAIASAKGFSIYANKKKVRLTRANSHKPIIVDCEAAQDDSRLDLPVYPGDKIDVPHSIF
jgi:polysaccharide export outer membrane protein